MDLKERLKWLREGWRFVRRIVMTTFSRANKDLDIWDLQSRFNAVKGKVMEFDVTDVGYKAWFKVQDGQVHIIENPLKVDGSARFTLTTLLNLVKGSIEVHNPATGQPQMVPYTPMEAYLYGDLQVYGEAATNDVFLFVSHIYKELYPKIREDLVQVAS